MLAWLSILAYRNGAKKENLGDKLAKIAPGTFSPPARVLPHLRLTLGKLLNICNVFSIGASTWNGSKCLQDLEVA